VDSEISLAAWLLWITVGFHASIVSGSLAVFAPGEKMVAHSVGRLSIAARGSRLFHPRARATLALHVFHKIAAAMPVPAWIAVPAQLFLMACAIVMAVWSHGSWLTIGAFAVMTVDLALLRGTKYKRTTLFWICAIIACASSAKTFVWDPFFAVQAALAAVALWLGQPSQWQIAAMIWSFLASAICAGAGYVQNANTPFYVGILSAIMLLVLARNLFRFGVFGAQVVNTILIILIGLPAADFFMHPRHTREVTTDTAWKFYSFHAAKGDPGSFARWWGFFLDHTEMSRQPIFEATPGGDPPYRLRPNSHQLLFDSPVSINSKGFRGPEIPTEKGDTYRIVALGESTTFGMTLHPQDKPWPELLEQMIRENLKPGRPVEVINAGVPAYSLKANLKRLPKQILPLHPDMIISYHGFNGFSFIDSALPPASGHSPPKYQARPLQLLADTEYRFRMLVFRHRAIPKTESDKKAQVKPMDTVYADLYRQLIQIARTNGIRLVIANYSMAVDRKSDPKIIEFYRSAFDLIYSIMPANEIHSALVSDLTEQHLEVYFVDTHPHLEGENEKFIDIMHLTQEGRRQLATNIFEGIRGVLEKDLQSQ
jgi:lysophospholipase L1-like esterase